MNATRWVRAVLSAGVTALVLGCGDSSPLAVNPRAPTPEGSLLDSLVVIASQHTGLLRCSPLPADSATQIIGPDGGTVQAGAYSLSIPAGALSGPVAITAVAPSDTVNRVQFQPQGLTFQQAASLTMSYANCGAVYGTKQVAYTNDALEILELVSSVDDATAQTVTGQVNHFSDYAIAW